VHQEKALKNFTKLWWAGTGKGGLPGGFPRKGGLGQAQQELHAAMSVSLVKT